MRSEIPVKDVTPVKVHKPKNSNQNDNYTPRNRIYVRAVEGTYETIRRFFGLIFLGLFAIIPWLSFDGSQAVLFNLVEQRFKLFGLTLWPQDLTLLAWLLIVSAYALFFITTFAGRVWCGFMCPQTTWTFIFIWFEEKLEGSRNKRMKLDQRPMDFDKFWRKTLKHTSWSAVALLTALTFVGYFTPIEQLFRDFLFLDVSFWAGFSVLFFTVCTYANAGWMREVMCTHICPYARFQSAMFDKDTFTVAYDSKRGDQRGPRPRKMAHAELADNGLGECVDCNLCVQVCPTGIDIRNGLQYECINCGACVDACNGVMEKMKYPKGLISFTSEQELNGDTTHILRPKLIGYAIVLMVMVGLLVFEILNRSTLEVDIIRDRNSLYRETNLGLIENVYTLKLLNKSQQERIFSVSVKGLPEYQLFGKKTVSVRGGEVYSLPVSVATDAYNLQSRVTEIYFHVQTTAKDGTLITVDEPSKFLYK